MTNTAWLMLICLSILWGGSFFFVEIAVAELPPLWLVWLRVTGAAAVLLLFLLVTKRSLPLSREALIAFCGMGLLNNLIPFSLIAWGQGEISSGLASILNAMTPVSTFVLAHFFTDDEKLTPARLIGVALGVAGVVVLIGVDALSGLGLAVLAQCAVLLATLSYGFAGIWGRRFRRMGLDPVVAAAGQVSASSVLLAVPALMLATPWALPMPSVTVWAAMAGLAVFSTALAYVLFFRVLALAGAANVMLVTLLVPPSAILLGWLFLDEQLATNHVAGLLLIMLGLVIIDTRVVAILRSRLAA